MPFYTYNQNNSGGRYQLDEYSGIAEYVIIEANNAKQANAIATSIGIYFNGVEEGNDCSCCGDRWYTAEEYDATEIPSIYSDPVETHKGMFSSYSSAVHYLNGEIKRYKHTK